MSVASHHAEWLRLVEKSGPFLSMPVLLRVFPQGLEPRDPAKASKLRELYDDWQERGRKQPAVHQAWIRHVLTDLLDYRPEFLVEGQGIPPGIEAAMANFGETLRPDYVLKHRDSDKKPLLLIQQYPPDQDLAKPAAGKFWKATPGTRMMELLHAADLPLGLVTNGEEWMLVYAPRGETTGFASWYADLWMQEPLTLRAFHSLLHLRRLIGVAESDTLAALFVESSKDQQEVTSQLGYQVRQAVEVLVQAFDRIDAESGRTLLAGVSEKTLYDGALTIMMRLVFLFSAEERGLLLLNDPLYDQNYAVSTLSQILRERADQQGEEVLERRHDAWCRLLATFRAVYAGVEHEAMRLPPYGGTLFDPDRYPFLEGRALGSLWKSDPAKPLPVNNRVVLHLLEALQLLRVKVPGGGPAEALRLSFSALDVEQIGHVYEGLLDHTAVRARETVLGLTGSKDSEPEIPLSKLETVRQKGVETIVEFLHEETGRSEKALKHLLEEPPVLDEHALLIACGQDPLLAKRIKPFAALLRQDSFGQLVVVTEGSVYVTSGGDRRSTGTHYTPRTLTEPIVQYTLEPLVYVGPAEGTPKAEWKLKSPREILALKICDMTMGSGAFLVQTCRYVAERLVEAWEDAEKEHPGCFIVTPEGELSTGSPAERLMPADAAERLVIARRFVADRCLYGVDINPMAVEMAKLSLWLITLQRDRPFTFLDHALKCGDSLLGVSSVKQIENFSLRAGEQQVTFATANLFRYVDDASAKRRALEALPSNDHTQIEAKNHLHAEAEAATAKVKALADCLIAFELRGLDGDSYDEQRTLAADHAELAMQKALPEFQSYSRDELLGRLPFHWAVEFPEVFATGGFDGFVGNPPFMGGRLIGRALGSDYHDMIALIRNNVPGSPDLCAYFILRAYSLLRTTGFFGLLATKTISETGTRSVCLDRLIHGGATIFRAFSRYRWPGAAAVVVSVVHVAKGEWCGGAMLDKVQVDSIDGGLAKSDLVGTPFALAVMKGKFSQGQDLMGRGFELDEQERGALLSADPTSSSVVFPLFNGQDLNTMPELKPYRWAIYFNVMTEHEARRYKGAFARLKELVEPYRDGLTGQIHQDCFWKFWDLRPKLMQELEGHEEILASAIVTKYVSFRRVSTKNIYNHETKLYFFYDWCDFAVLQSSLHQEWAHWRCATLGATTFRYSTSAALATWPNPPFADSRAALNQLGQEYHRLRHSIMVSRPEGLTKTYNRFHDSGEKSEDIARLRALHVEMDQAVATAYGWGAMDLGHGFHQARQGMRYTISESARGIVLGRLLALNHQRYEEEVKAGLHPKKSNAKSARRRSESKGVLGDAPVRQDEEPNLFGREK